MKDTTELKQMAEAVSRGLQYIQANCLGTCKIAGTKAFIIEHDPKTGYTVTFEVRESGGTSLDHFTRVEYDDNLDHFENFMNMQGQPPITEWSLKESEPAQKIS